MMRIGQVEQDYVTLRIGTGDQGATHRIYEATAEDVVDLLAPVLENAGEITRITIRQHGKGNKPHRFNVPGKTDVVAKRVMKALTDAADD